MSKYLLTDLIISLNKEEIKNFKIYINRIQFKDDKKLENLFNIIKQKKYDEYSVDIVQLMTRGNKNAYYRLKNRLIDEIEQSLLLIHRKKDDHFNINNHIELARISIYKNDYERAYQYLLKAEKIACKTENFSLCNLIYDHMIDLSKTYRKVDPKKIIQKQKENTIRLQHFRAVNSAIAVITNELGQTNFSGKNSQVTTTLNDIVQQLQLGPLEQQSPTVQFAVFNCVKNILLQTKQFDVLEEYLSTSLEDFANKKLFTKAHHHDKIVLLSWLINTLFKNKKIQEAEQYIKALYDALHEFNKLNYQHYIWMYYQSEIILKTFLDQNQEAIKLVYALKDNPPSKNIPHYDLLIYLNLTTLHYCESKLEKALYNISQIIITDIFSNLSADLQLNVLIVELILKIENEDFIYVEQKVKNIRKTYRKLLKEDNFIREKEFISILLGITQAIEYPISSLNISKRLEKKINAFITDSPPFEPGSNEAINYKCWLEAKLAKQSYFERILQEVNNV